MAENDGPDPSLFSLLPSDLKNIADAAEYAKKRKEQLKKLSESVKKMGYLSCFWDSKVAQSNRGWFNISFRFSDPKEIETEIKTCLKLLKDMLKAVDKVDDGLKTEEEREMPYLIIINLNAELNNLFEIAHVKIETATSKTVTTMYNQFLESRPEIESKMKKIETVFLKQQCMAERRRHEKLHDDIQKASREVASYREQELIDLQEEVDQLKEENKNLQESVLRNNRMMEHLMKRLEDFGL